MAATTYSPLYSPPVFWSRKLKPVFTSDLKRAISVPISVLIYSVTLSGLASALCLASRIASRNASGSLTSASLGSLQPLFISACIKEMFSRVKPSLIFWVAVLPASSLSRHKISVALVVSALNAFMNLSALFVELSARAADPVSIIASASNAPSTTKTTELSRYTASKLKIPISPPPFSFIFAYSFTFGSVALAT